MALAVDPQIEHLLRRAGFGGRPDEISQLRNYTVAQAVQYLVDYDSIPDDVDSLRRLLRERSAERDLAYEALKIKTLEVEKLKMQLAKLRRMQFGRSSEKLDGQIAQLELAIEELEASEAPVTAPAAVGEAEVGSG